MVRGVIFVCDMIDVIGYRGGVEEFFEFVIENFKFVDKFFGVVGFRSGEFGEYRFRRN